jgi:2-methylcitrate dehydratase PrpD
MRLELRHFATHTLGAAVARLQAAVETARAALLDRAAAGTLAPVAEGGRISDLAPIGGPVRGNMEIWN